LLTAQKHLVDCLSWLQGQQICLKKLNETKKKQFLGYALPSSLKIVMSWYNNYQNVTGKLHRVKFPFLLKNVITKTVKEA